MEIKMMKQDYFDKGQTWEYEIVANALSSRNRAWVMASFMGIIACLSLITLCLVLPLKTFVPYVITVDRQTGYYEVSKGLKDAALSSDEAVTQSNLVRYVSLREQYNPAILKDNFETIVMMSEDSALKDYRHLWSSKNPDNPSIKLGRKTTIDIKIKSVSFISDKIASVRFIRETRSPEGIKTSHWNAIIEFIYTQKPLQMKERFENPLGFRVINYRVNPEALETLS